MLSQRRLQVTPRSEKPKRCYCCTVANYDTQKSGQGERREHGAKNVRRDHGPDRVREDQRESEVDGGDDVLGGVDRNQNLGAWEMRS